MDCGDKWEPLPAQTSGGAVHRNASFDVTIAVEQSIGDKIWHIYRTIRNVIEEEILPDEEE